MRQKLNNWLILPLTRYPLLMIFLAVLAVPSISHGARCIVTATQDLIGTCSTQLADGDTGRIIGVWQIDEANGGCDHEGLTVSLEEGNQFDFANEAVNLKLFFETGTSPSCSPSYQIGSTIANPTFSGGTESFTYTSEGVAGTDWFIVTVDDDTGDAITNAGIVRDVLAGKDKGYVQ